MPEIINKQKAPKDILLNSILHEIDEENGIITEEVIPQKKKTKKKPKKKNEQHPLLRILFYFLTTMIVLFLMFMLVMITLTKEEKQEKMKVNIPVSPVEEAKKFVPKKVYHSEDFSTSPLKKEGNTIVGTMNKKTQVKGKEAKESRRKTAKEKLLEQMKK